MRTHRKVEKAVIVCDCCGQEDIENEFPCAILFGIDLCGYCHSEFQNIFLPRQDAYKALVKRFVKERAL